MAGRTDTDEIALLVADTMDDRDNCAEDDLECIARAEGLVEGIYLMMGGDEMWEDTSNFVNTCRKYRDALEALERHKVDLENAKSKANEKKDKEEK